MWVGDGLGLRDWKTGFLSPDLIMDRNFFHPQHTLFGCIFVFQICAASNFLDDNSSCKPSPSGQFETRKLQQLDGGSSVYIICWLIALWQVPQFCNLIGFGIGFYMPWKLGSNAPEISNLLFSLFLWTESQNPLHLHTEWSVPETSSLHPPPIPCCTGLVFVLKTCNWLPCKPFVRTRSDIHKWKSPILQLFFTQDFFKCLVGWWHRYM